MPRIWGPARIQSRPRAYKVGPAHTKSAPRRRGRFAPQRGDSTAPARPLRLRLRPDRLIPIDPARRAPSPQPHVPGLALVSAFGVNLSAASTQTGKRPPAAGAALVGPVFLDELRVRGQAHPQISLQPQRVRPAQSRARSAARSSRGLGGGGGTIVSRETICRVAVPPRAAPRPNGAEPHRTASNTAEQTGRARPSRTFQHLPTPTTQTARSPIEHWGSTPDRPETFSRSSIHHAPNALPTEQPAQRELGGHLRGA